MEKEITATFMGHKECFGLENEAVKAELVKLIEQGVCVFLNGGMGGFDWKCAGILRDLKKEYLHIKSYLVIPYLTFKVTSPEYFDEIIYPEGFERYHFKAAIPARNKYMVENSSYALCYVNHGWGGAAQTYEKAIKKGLTLINLGTLV